MFSVKKYSRNKIRGFTLTELAIVLGIMGLILGAIWTAASKVYFNQKITKAVTQTLAIAEATKNAFPNGTIPGGQQWLTGFLINSGAVPSDMIQSCTGLTWGANPPYYSGTAGCAVGPWHNQVMAITGGWGMPYAANRFQIGTNGLTATECAAFLAAVIPAAVNDGLVNVYMDYIGVVAVNSNTSPATFSTCPANNTVILQFQL